MKVPGWFLTNRRTARAITIPDFMLHYRPIVIKQLGCSRKTDKVVVELKTQMKAHTPMDA